MTGLRPITRKRRAQLREFHSLDLTQGHFLRMTGVHRVTVCKWAREMGLKFRKDNAGWASAIAVSKGRAEVMASLYRDGYTLEQIGAQYGITRERVRQLMTKHLGIRQEDGGHHKRSQRSRVARQSAKDGQYLKDYGCTFEQWRALRDIGHRMIADGRGRFQQPLYAFNNQRNNAKARGIGWELTLWQWWSIWQASGHWEQRGRGQGYVMSRIGDVGPYAAGNVFIKTAAENSSEAQIKKRKDRTLPIGVARTASGRYTAHRAFNGKTYGLGTHDTPELAYAAYLMAAQPESRAA